MLLAIENSIPAMIEKRKSNKMKLGGFAMQLDTIVWCICIAIIVAIVLVAGLSLRKDAKINATKAELDQLRSAVVQYEATSDTGMPPTSIDELFNTYVTVDGTTHEAILTKTGRWLNRNAAVDQWGNPYQITSGDTRKITSNGDPIDNKPISIDY